MNASSDDTLKVLNFTLLQQIESVTVSSKCGPKLWVVESTACGPHVSSRLYWKHGSFLNSRCHLGFQDSWPEKSHPWEIQSQCWAGLGSGTASLGMPGGCLGLLSIEHSETLRATLCSSLIRQARSLSAPSSLYSDPLLFYVLHLITTSSNPTLLLDWCSSAPIACPEVSFSLDRTTGSFSTVSESSPDSL